MNNCNTFREQHTSLFSRPADPVVAELTPRAMLDGIELEVPLNWRFATKLIVLVSVAADFSMASANRKSKISGHFRSFTAKSANPWDLAKNHKTSHGVSLRASSPINAYRGTFRDTFGPERPCARKFAPRPDRECWQRTQTSQPVDGCEILSL